MKEEIIQDKILLLLLIILAVIFIVWAYVAIEPIIYAFTGFGFAWDYNKEFIPILHR